MLEDDEEEDEEREDEGGRMPRAAERRKVRSGRERVDVSSRGVMYCMMLLICVWYFYCKYDGTVQKIVNRTLPEAEMFILSSTGQHVNRTHHRARVTGNIN